MIPAALRAICVNRFVFSSLSHLPPKSLFRHRLLRLGSDRLRAYDWECIFLLLQRPYNGRSRNEIREEILARQVQVKSHEVPEGWDPEIKDFINRLLQRKPENRLGNMGAEEVKNHPWIRNLNWKRLATKEIESPFVPAMKKKHFDQD